MKQLQALRSARSAVTVAAATLLCSAAYAHHSFAQFQMTKSQSIQGTVKEFQWTNPHTWLVVTVADGKGGQADWRLEGSSVVELTRAGWSRHSVQPGDRVTADYHPLRSGEPGGAFIRIHFADGRVLGK